MTEPSRSHAGVPWTAPQLERGLADGVEGAAERSSTRALAGWTVFSLLVLYALLLGGSWLGIYVVGLRALSLAITAVGLGAWLVVAWRRPEWRPRTAIWPAFALPLAALGLSALASPYQRLGLEYVAWSVLLTALYLLLVRILALPYARARIGGLAAILGLVLGLAYVGWVLVLWVEWWGLVGSIQAPPLRPLFLGLTWGNPSAVLTVEVLLLLIAAAGLGFGSRGARLTLALLTLVTGLVVVMTGSRAGWVALPTTAAIVGAFWLVSNNRRAIIVRALADRRIRVALASGATAVVGVAVILSPVIVARVMQGDGGRISYFTTALRMFADAPLLGLGPGTWAARRIAYTEAGELDFTIPHAHNVYLHTAAELGLVGLGVGVVAFACVGWLILGAIRGHDPVRRRWAWAAGIGLVYLGLHSLFDYYANMPAVLLLVAIPIATLDATAARSLGFPTSLRLPSGLAGAARPLRALALGALVVGSAASVLYLARAESVAFAHQAAVTAENAAAWEAALAPATSAARDDPAIPPYQVTLGLAAAGSGDWPTAERAFAAAVAVDDLSATWLGLAYAQLQNGAPSEEVARSLERALRLGVQQPAVTFAAAQLYDGIGLSDPADDAFVRTLASMPEIVADGDWAGVVGSPDRADRLLDRAIAEAPGAGWELALMAGDPRRAQALASDDAGSAFASLVIDAWGGDEEALAGALAAADGDPLNGFQLAWAARLSERAGDPEAAERYRRLVDLGLRGQDQGFKVAIGEREPLRDAALGTNSYNYGSYMHRRTTTVDLIVPGLPGLVIVEEAPDEGL